MGVTYRAWQFWRALLASPTCEELEQVKVFLSPKLYALFCAMQPDEQAHSFAIFSELKGKGQHHPDLLVAALLHDSGKSRYKLHMWERVIIVIGKAVFPERSKQWGTSGRDAWERSWRRAFVIAEQHPIWGAQMAEEAGATPLAVRLIRWHQEDPHQSPANFTEVETILLEKIRVMDGLN